MSRPERDRLTGGLSHARLRASHADREQVIEVLKAAFVQGRLTKDELDERAGQALSARTYAELTAVTADLPVGLITDGMPKARTPRNPAVRTGVRVIVLATLPTVGLWLGALLPGVADQMGALLILVTWIWFGIMILTASVLLQSRLEERSARQPPRSTHGGGGQACATRAGRLPPADHGRRHLAEASRRRPSRRPVRGCATGYAGS